jgi:Ohr subfamily peroxiredoxin
MAEPLYTATSTSWGGRDGRVVSSDGRVDLSLSVPKGLGGDDGPGTNPEQLFASGYAACFHSALKLVARQQKADIGESAVSVTVSLVPDDDGFGLGVRIEGQLPGVDRATGHKLLEAADAVCPYSRATHGNIPSEVVLVEDE